MPLSAIVVTDMQNGIGKNNQLLCHLPADLKFFKSTTLGHPVIMGRKTFDSIGKLLHGRKNIIISRNKNLKIEGAEVFDSINSVLKQFTSETIFIIGGAELYNQTFQKTEIIYRTLIHHRFDADVFFPEIKFDEFHLVWEEDHKADEKNKFDYTFQKWQRI